MTYLVHLENFEGPLDLLLYFIQRDEIDIHDIPIAHITAEYLRYLEVMEALNLAIAGEFILLAATLMRIKARMLLPRSEPLEDELIEDPREILVQRLIEYQRFKKTAEELQQLAITRSAFYPSGIRADEATNGVHPGEYLQDISLFQLMNVVKEVMERMSGSDSLVVLREPVKLDESIRKIQQFLAVTRRITLRSVLEQASHIQEVVVTFLAVLEMMRRGMLKVEQKKPFQEIYLVRTIAD
jgi:segregation and condensation protein A